MGAMDQIRSKPRRKTIAVEGVKVDVKRMTRPEFDAYLDKIREVADAPEGEEPTTEEELFAELFFEPGSDDPAFTPEFVKNEIPVAVRRLYIAEFFRVQGRVDSKN